jgi:hypothetical protein
MKLLFALFVSLAIFTACGKNNKTNYSGMKKDSTTQSTGGSTTDPQNAEDTKSPAADTSDPGASSSLTNVEYGVSTLPPTLKGYNGSIVAMAKWEDKLGANVLFVTETEEQSKDDNRSKELYAYHYTITDKENKLVWKINDFVKECPVDITLQYMPGSISITDLNENGIAESTFLYKMSCKGDVSSDAMKLMMHEGEAKYAIRGEMNLIMSGESMQKGKMTVDAAFDKAPKEFLDYAKEQWNKFNTEKIGN